MISHEEIKDLVTEWRLREDIIEKDYVIGWILWGIGSDPDLSSYWAFKGGTCLKKCYIETYRFSEDLDFTVLPNGPVTSAHLIPIIKRVLSRVSEESGINFSVKEPILKDKSAPAYIEGRIYYRGPRNAPMPSNIKLDLNSTEQVVQPSVLCKISHPYSDTFEKSAKVRCYSFEELFAEKIRAMGERCRPRDLYDIVNLFWNHSLHSHPKLINDVLIKKCKAKNIPVTSFEGIKSSPFLEELKGEWKNMLAHQLQELPSFNKFWEELPNLFNWLNGAYKPVKNKSIPYTKEEDKSWVPPPTIWNWGIGKPLETIRFAAANHLCIELGYNDETRLLEPYSLRKTKNGQLLLHGIRVDNNENRSYYIDNIQSIKVTGKPFNPRYKIEFSHEGPITSKPTRRKR